MCNVFNSNLLPAKRNGKFARALKQSVEYATDLPVFLFCMAALLIATIPCLSFFIEKMLTICIEIYI
jgi:hypothetical protein